jgi:hypothetical protein
MIDPDPLNKQKRLEEIPIPNSDSDLDRKECPPRHVQKTINPKFRKSDIHRQECSPRVQHTDKFNMQAG